ncbi:unnamed protein product [Dicrocoelium dendriticum]|nr:unnamed protein product [Dicrocoelium dendriticum]
MWLLIGIVWFIELATCVAQAQGKTPDSTAFSNYNVALKHASNNTCPYLIHGSKKLPVICWVCHFPHGMSQSNRYTYDCCPGYERSTMVNNKCVQMEVTWKPIIQYLRDRGYVKAAQALNTNTGIEDLATSLANSVYTVFVPQEDNDLDDADPSYSGRDNAARMLVAAGRHYSYGFTNGRKIRNEHSTDLKITTYSNGLVFIECKMLLSVDHETTNGLVHYTDGVSSIPCFVE